MNDSYHPVLQMSKFTAILNSLPTTNSCLYRPVEQVLRTYTFLPLFRYRSVECYLPSKKKKSTYYEPVQEFGFPFSVVSLPY